MAKIARPLAALSDHPAIVTFIEGTMTDTANRFNERKALITPPAAKGVT